MIPLQSALQILEVSTLPAASANPGALLRQGGKLWSSNGTTWVDIEATGSGGGGGGVIQDADVTVFVGGKPVDGEELLRVALPDAMTLPAGLTGSRASAGVAATSSAVFSLRKNGVEFGTATFAASGSTATFAAATATSFVAGDVLTVVGPATADATLADIGITLDGSGATLSTVTITTPITVNVPNKAIEHYATVAVVGVTPSSRVTLALGAHGPADENEADMLDIAAMAASPGTGSIDIAISFATPSGGPINLIATIM